MYLVIAMICAPYMHKRAHAQRTMGVATSVTVHVHVYNIAYIRSHIAGRNMAVWLAFVFSFVYCVVSQAPGDGDSLCTDEFINGDKNPFYDSRPTYADNVRPLMDSRNYVVLLEVRMVSCGMVGMAGVVS